MESASPGGSRRLDPSRVTDGRANMPANVSDSRIFENMPSMGFSSWYDSGVPPSVPQVSYTAAPAAAGGHADRARAGQAEAVPAPMDRVQTLNYDALQAQPAFVRQQPQPPEPPVQQPPTAAPAIRAASRVVQQEGAGRDGRPASSMKKLPTYLRELRDLAMKYVRIVCICLILSFGAAGLPILGALELLSDRNYTFWMGVHYPMMVIFGCIGVTLLMVIIILLLIKHAKNYIQGKITFMILQSIFASLLGVVLVYLWVAQTRNLNQTADRISLGCMNSMPEASILADYGTVLYNLRVQPECINRTSVELCEGWHENEYTSYLKYVELEFKCGPMCRDLQLPAGAVQGAGTQLLQEGAMTDPYYHSHGSVWLQEEAGMALAPVSAIRLFSPGYTRMSCAPMVSTRLRVLAFCFSDLMFKQGFMLILCAITMSLVAIAQVAFGDFKDFQATPSAAGVNERMPIVPTGTAPRHNPRYSA